jgi:hypothetical protein
MQVKLKFRRLNMEKVNHAGKLPGYRLTRCGASSHIFLRIEDQYWKCLKCGVELETFGNKAKIVREEPLHAARATLDGSRMSLQKDRYFDRYLN